MPATNVIRKTNVVSLKGWSNLVSNVFYPKSSTAPIITGFYNPESSDYDFMKFYELLKEKGFVIYPGKVTGIDSFRIGTIGHVFPEDIDRLLLAIKDSMYWM